MTNHTKFFTFFSEPMLLMTAITGLLVILHVQTRALTAPIEAPDPTPKATPKEDMIMKAYDTDGFISQASPRHLGFSNIETQNCQDIEAAYDVQEAHKVQVVKRVTYPAVTLQHCDVKVKPALIFCGGDGIYRRVSSIFRERAVDRAAYLHPMIIDVITTPDGCLEKKGMNRVAHLHP